MLERDNTIFSFSAGQKPVAKLSPGETLVVETADYSNGRINERGQNLEGIDLNDMPATGPFYVLGAEPGDALVIEIIEINCGSRGIAVINRETGMLYKEKGPVVKIYEREGDRLTMAEGLSLPIRPMVGIIGVAPDVGEISCRLAGRHGGRLWAREVCVGNTVSLPVFHPGALLALGDVQPVLGDGAVCGHGIGISSTVKIKVDVVKGEQLTGPRVGTKTGSYFLASGRSLPAANRIACRAAIDYITEAMGLEFDEACILATAVGHLGICRAVGPSYVVKFFVPKLL